MGYLLGIAACGVFVGQCSVGYLLDIAACGVFVGHCSVGCGGLLDSAVWSARKILQRVVCLLDIAM